ncbi:TerD family protein [Lentzea aerocolonigenes]|uniref:TerD family protein n=1 Tax=Lentzea aerocolonigenes TaxID=68170 RepID=UPI00068B2842|nr:TerD family protein [Lentzea aerocolonigenes]MCP2248424.1 TerD domain [Lentzea aerocolonigenes]
MRTTIIKKTLRVPLSDGAAGDGGTTARQLDAALLKVGFKASRELLEHVSGTADAVEYSHEIVRAVKELVGAQAQHNPYFKDFPRNVPDTVEFWLECIGDVAEFTGNLLDLPKYGRVQHTYDEMLAAHDELIPSLKDRVTVLHLGGTLDDEITRLYLELAASPIPLGEADRALLGELATQRLDLAPGDVPTRENRAILNAARLVAQRPLTGIDTVTDVLRLASEASGGDVTLREPTRFRSFRRAERRALLAALNEVAPSKFGDVHQHREAWKRLGERLHPHEYPFEHAQDVFAVARKEKTVRSFAGQVEVAFAEGDADLALRILAKAPGMLLRQVDRLVRHGASNVEEAVRAAAPDVSGRVLVSVLEHLANREKPDAARVFANRGRKVWIEDDTRPPLDPAAVAAITAVVEDELVRRLPDFSELVVDPEVLDVVVPMSGTATEDGFGVLPRGSKLWFEGDVLRFFVHWRQRAKRTDYDLSAALLDENFEFKGHVSWTWLKRKGAYYSGDVTEAADGATEFIDLHADALHAKYVVPQVNIYSGEGFDDVAESMFGFMSRDLDQMGKPFEPSTVRARSAMRGKGKVALPMMFEREGDSWYGTWLHLYLRGTSWGNRVEQNRDLVKLIASAALHRKYFTVRKLAELFEHKGSTSDAPTIHIGLSQSETGGVTTVAQLGNMLSD